MSGIAQDIRYALRSLFRTPALTLTLVFTLGLGIAGTTAIFSVVYGVLLRPLPFPDADRVVRLCEIRPTESGFCSASAVNVADLAKGSAAVDVAGAARQESFVLEQNGRKSTVRGAVVTAGFLQTFGVTPAFGRMLTDDDLVRGANDVALVSYRFWQNQLGGLEEIVGQTLSLDDRQIRLLGVLSPDAYLPEFDTIDVWRPLTASVDNVDEREWRGFAGVAKSKAGIALDAFTADLVATHRRLKSDHPAELGESVLQAEGIRARMIAPVQRTLWMFQGAALLVLVIACANVGGLLMVRASKRSSEFAVRVALGAGQGRLLRQLLAEAALLSAGGVTIGLMLASWATAAVLLLAPRDTPRLSEVVLDGPVALFALLVAVVTTFLFALAPLRGPRQAIAALRGQRSTGERSRARSAFAFVQLTLAFALLVGASLLTRAFIELSAWDPGFQKDGVAITWLLAPPASYGSADQAVSALEDARDRVARMPGVVAAGLASAGPMFGGTEPGQLTLQDGTSAGESVDWFDVDPNYFATLGAPLRRGRALATTDSFSAPPVAVVNEAFTRKYFPDRDPLGQRVSVNDHAADIVGVVPDFKPGHPDEAVRPQIYWPIQQYRRFAAYLVIRMAPGATVNEGTLKAGIAEVVPSVQVSTLTSLAAYHDRTLVSPQFNMAVLGVFALVAIVLAAVGVYGVIAFNVTSRRREIGLRVALGASPHSVVRRFAMESVRLALAGGVAGLVVALLLAKGIKHLLYGVPPFDLPSLVGVAVCYLLVTLTAGYLPARGASRVDPVRALAAE